MHAIFRATRHDRFLQPINSIIRCVRSQQISAFDIQDKVGIITGGADGIGLACAKELLKNGAKGIAIGDLQKEDQAMEQIAKDCGPGKAIFVQTNVTKPLQLEALFKATISKWKRLDFVINNAGILDDEHWEDEIETNVTAVVRGTYLAMEYMGRDKGGDGGIIVNISSTFGLQPFSGSPVYVGTKHFVLGFGRSLGDHYKRTGVKVITLCPGVKVRTQTAASGMVTLLMKGDSGSVWISEGEAPVYQVHFPHIRNVA